MMKKLKTSLIGRKVVR